MPLDLQNLSLQQQAELEIIRGMYHHPDVRYSTSISLDEILFTHPNLRDAFKVLSSARDVHSLDSLTLQSLAGKLGLQVDIPDIVGKSAPPEKETLRNHYRIVRDEGSRTAYLNLNKEMLARVQAGEDLAKLMQESLSRTREIQTAALPSMPPPPSMKALVRNAITNLEEYHRRIAESNSHCTGLSTGFANLDKLTDGLHPGITLLASRPSVNLTNFALNVALQASKENRVMYVSCSQDASYLTLRALHIKARVSIRDTKEGFLAERDFPKLNHAARFLANETKLQIYDNLFTAQDIYKQASWEKTKNDLRLLIIDSFGKIIPQTHNHRDKEIAALETASQLERMVSQLKIPIVVLAEIGKEPDRKARDKRPYIGDIRDFGALEYLAHPIIMLHKLPYEDEEYEDRKEQLKEGGVFSENISPVSAYIERNSFGPNGEVALSYFGENGNFESAAKVNADDMPVDV